MSKLLNPLSIEIDTEVEFTHFYLRDYEALLKNQKQANENKLIALFKLFSKEHLLKLPFLNDSNSLDKGFYNEFLHIIGLTETKQGGKKLIERKKEEEQDLGSLLEETITQLDSLDKIDRLPKPSRFGENHQERLFHVALELVITWVNRILFLKLLEGQLISYHKGNKDYAFLNADRIKEFDDLNALFFQVLARKHEDRKRDFNSLLKKYPILIPLFLSQPSWNTIHYLSAKLYKVLCLRTSVIFSK